MPCPFMHTKFNILVLVCKAKRVFAAVHLQGRLHFAIEDVCATLKGGTVVVLADEGAVAQIGHFNLFVAGSYCSKIKPLETEFWQLICEWILTVLDVF
jgi:hypothetical protein